MEIDLFSIITNHHSNIIKKAKCLMIVRKTR
jgi:hypothetical protein